MKLSDVRKVYELPFKGHDAENKMNLMLNHGWRILNSYTVCDEVFPYQYENRLFYVLGHDDDAAEVPKTEYELKQVRYDRGADLAPDDSD